MRGSAMLAYARLSSRIASAMTVGLVFGAGSGGLTLGCAAVLGFDEFVAGTRTDDVDAGSDDAGAEPVLAVADWYVSPNGDDESDGTREHPLRSLSESLVRATSSPRENDAGAQRIAMCVGTYVESSVQISGALELRGGYGCSTWERPAGTRGRPGPNFASGPRIESTGTSIAFFNVEAAGSASPVLDGLQVRATEHAAAISVLGGAELSNLSVVNDTVPTSTGAFEQTVGIFLENSTAHVAWCAVAVSQRFGTKGATAAIGIFAGKGSPQIEQSDLSIRDVQGTAEGIALDGTTDLALHDNTITLSNCVSPAEDQFAAIGILSLGASGTSSRNTVKIETPGSVDAAIPTTLAGMRTLNGGSLRSDGDRIFGPRALLSTRAPDGARFYGFRTEGGLDEIVNASIALDARAFSLQNSAGVFVQQPQTLRIAHDTMYFATAPSNAGTAIRGIWLNDATDGQAGSVTIASNLFVTGDPRSVVLRASCTTPGIAAFAHNRWAGFDALAIGNGCNAGEPLDQIWPTAAADDDRSFDCPASGCADLFVDGSIENSGSSSQGLSLEPSTACGRPLTAPRDPAVTTDADGRTRATSATVGAYELTCTR